MSNPNLGIWSVSYGNTYEGAYDEIFYTSKPKWHELPDFFKEIIAKPEKFEKALKGEVIKIGIEEYVFVAMKEVIDND